ncbi:hypothetical protein BM525_18875 (plasmid) [Alteromonas mediterranea]|uniref:Uncharacterized protein n=1 Tax=Alteromonas mediterranea TaxID=314275 RepID=A0AAC9JFF0_9ALTE|nr:hypothetical protein [Alteromonas mediterranea]APD91947.1 hypothetical protein BM524_18680 [Alteromonas mediterranea]APD99801.1 hypothetical protein BM525_18875 [Alteromonas mediterranea]
MRNELIIANNASTLPDLISDSDGVITDFSSAFHSYMHDVLGLKPIANEPRSFDYSDVYPSYDSPAKHIKDFINNPDYFGDIGIYPEALIALKKLHSAGVRITIVTSIGDSPDVMRARLDLYNRELTGVVDDVIFLPFCSEKSETLKTFSRSIFIDDLIGECVSATANGHDAFLFPRNYNRYASPSTGIKTLVNNWRSLPYFSQSI